MSFLMQLVNRTLPALVLGVGVMLLAAGLFTYAPAGLGDGQPTTEPPAVAGDPLLSAPPGADDPTPEPGATSGTGSEQPAATDAPSAPTDPPGTPADPGATPLGPLPTPAEPGPTAPPAGPTTQPAGPTTQPAAPRSTPWPVLPTPTPAAKPPTSEPAPSTALPASGKGVASRIRITSLRINLPVVSGDIKVRGNRNNYPLCDVAQYLTYFGQPGQVGSTYIYAHAQRGMFLPMLKASRVNDGASMIGAQVEVWTTDNKRYLYKIFRVKRHATNFALATNLAKGEHRLVLQTSEGPSGTPGKLQVAARLVSVTTASAAESNPTARPRVCLPG